MPAKGKSSQNKTQTTLSKFFISAGGSQLKTPVPGPGQLNPGVITDVNNDFQVRSDRGSKRPKETKQSDTGGPKSKRVYRQEEEPPDDIVVAAEQTSINTDKPGVSGQKESQQGTTSNKFKDFEYMENEQPDASRPTFEPRKPAQKVSKHNGNSFTTHQDSINSDSEDDIQLCTETENPEGSSFYATMPSSSASTSSLRKFRHGQGASSSNCMKGGEKGNQSGKYTPLEQQYLDIKSQYPDAVLFVECGYKYRFFGKDAEIAAEVLKIFCHLDHNFMTASIPVHRLYVHIRRLVAAGFKVGVVKQTETSHLKAASNNKSAPFTRKLKALYTKSTLIGEDVDPLSEDPLQGEDGSSHRPAGHYLMCVYQSQVNTAEMGFVCVDTATGEVIYDHFKDSVTFAELETRIAHLQPVEIILSTAASDSLTKIIKDISNLSVTQEDKIRLEFMDEEVFAHGQAISSLSQFYSKDQASLQKVLSLPKAVVSCLAALNVYLQDFQLDGVLSMASNFTKFSERSHYMYLSRQCLNNLEIFHNTTNGSQTGSLYWMLNHTCTKFGSRLLHRWLAQPLLDIEKLDQQALNNLSEKQVSKIIEEYIGGEIESRQQAVEELVNGKFDQLTKLRDMMSKLPDLERGLGSIFHKKCSLVEFCNIAKALEKVEKEMSSLHLEVNSPLLATLLTSIPQSLMSVKNHSRQINEKAARENDKPNLFEDDRQFPVVCERKKEIDDVLTTIQEHRKEVRLTLKQPGLQYVTVSQTEFLIEVKNSQLALVPSTWTQISSTKTVSRFHSPFIVKQYRRLCELREQLIIDVTAAWQQFLDRFSTEFIRYKQAAMQLATLDCLMSLAMTASQDGYCRPKVDNTRVHIDIQAGRHPIIDAVTHGQDQYVPNDTNLHADQTRVVVISGPNMGGKSSYIRQVALISILAQIGSYVPAEAASLGVIDAIYTRMGASDEIFQGRSTLMVELQEAGDIISQMTDRSLVVMDELGRGTSTHDGLAIAHATLDFLIRQCQCLVLFVTHFPMMSEFQEKYPDMVSNCHMAFLLNVEEEGQSRTRADCVTFLYQLTEGAAHKSYGLNVARLAQLPSDVVQRAAEKSRELEMRVTNRVHRQGIFTSLFTSGVNKLYPIIKNWQSS